MLLFYLICYPKLLDYINDGFYGSFSMPCLDQVKLALKGNNKQFSNNLLLYEKIYCIYREHYLLSYLYMQYSEKMAYTILGVVWTTRKNICLRFGDQRAAHWIVSKNNVSQN